MISIFANIFKTKQILVDLLKYNASLIWNLVPFDSIIFSLLEPSIKSDVPEMVLTLAFVTIKFKKYFFS